MKKILFLFLMLAQAACAQVYNYFAPGGALYGTATSQSINLAATGFLTGQLPISLVATGSWPGNAATATVAATATALGAVPTQCSGQFATGIAANGNANCATLPAYPVGANPTGTIGLSAVNGAATTFMRSDAAPVLSQSISPTMTGHWTFSPSAGFPITVNAATANPGITINGSNNYGLFLQGNSTSGASFGAYIAAGTTSGDLALNISNYNQSVEYAAVYGDGGAVFGSPSGADKGLGSINAQSIYQNGVADATVTGNIATATALATTPTQCSGTLATGVTANGNANCTTTIATAGNPIVSVPSGSGPTQIAYAFVTGSPSTCFASTSTHTANVVGCTYNGVGIYTVQFNGVLNNSYTPICQVTNFGLSGTLLIPELTTTGVGSGLITVRVQLYSTSFVNTDGSYMLTCFFQ